MTDHVVSIIRQFLGVLLVALAGISTAQEGDLADVLFLEDVARNGETQHVMRGQTSVNRSRQSWITTVQNPNGSWGKGKAWGATKRHPGVTGMVVSHIYNRPEELTEHLKSAGRNGLRWLIRFVSQPNLRDIVNQKDGARAHAFATFALCSAYPAHRRPGLGMAIDTSVDLILREQQELGGFGKAYSGKIWDLEVTALNLLALKKAVVNGGYSGRGKRTELLSALAKGRNFLMTHAYLGEGLYKTSSTDPHPSRHSGIAAWFLASIGESETKQVVDYIDKQIVAKRIPSYESIWADPSKWENWTKKNSLYVSSFDHRLMWSVVREHRPKAWKEWRRCVESVLIRAQDESGSWKSNESVFSPSDTKTDTILGTIFAGAHLSRKPFVLHRILKTDTPKYSAR
jgi:hypothetical protein